MHKINLTDLDLDELQAFFDVFFENLLSILDKRPTSEWSKILGVSKTTINTTWPKKRHFPRVDNIIKILQLTGISANWLLFGQGPMLMEDAYSEAGVEENIQRRRKVQDHITRLEKENDTLKKLFESANHAEFISKLFKSDIKQLLKKNAENLDEKSAKQIFDQLINPMVALIASFNLLSYKFLERVASSDNGAEKLRLLMNALITDELDAKKLSTRFVIKEMDKAFKKIDNQNRS